MLTETRTAVPPSSASVFNALRAAADALGQNFAYGYEGDFHFSRGDGWSISVRPESAGRLRIRACRFATPLATLWTSADDNERLKSLVLELDAEIDRVTR